MLRRNKKLMLIVFLVLIMVISAFYHLSKLVIWDKIDEMLDGPMTMRKTPQQSQFLRNQKHRQRGLSGWEIVRKAYNESYAFLDECPSNVPYRSCLLNARKQDPSLSVNNNWPWWFQTLLRDGGGNEDTDGMKKPNPPLFGFWHNLDMIDPPIRFCAIEKVGTKHWRNLQCLVNGREYDKGAPCPLTVVEQQALEHAFKHVVFLRDPMERFLSAFIDKCILLREERHCEPTAVFHDNDMDTDPQKNLMFGLLSVNQQQQQHYFEAYVDTMPLKWNMHFFPQSMYCDGLGRNIGQYDFIGQMGDHFYQDISNLAKQYSKSRNFEQHLDELFNYKRNLKRIDSTLINSDEAFWTPTMKKYPELYSFYSNYQQITNVNSSMMPGVETGAASRVHDFFTPATVKRLLEYFSIDYVKLKLPIPEWAEQILANDI